MENSSREGIDTPLLEYDVEKGRRTLDFRRLGIANLAPSRFTGGVTASPYRNMLDDRVTPAKMAINPFYKLMRVNQKTEAMVVARNWKLQRQTFKNDTATSMFIQRTFKVTKAQANVVVPHMKKTEKYQDKTAKWQKELLDATKDNKTDTSQWQKDTAAWQKDTLKVLNEAKDAIKEFREKGTGDKGDRKAEAKSIIKEAEGAIVKGALAGAAGAAAAGALKTIFPTFTRMFTAPFKSMGGLAKRLPGAAMATRAGGAVSRLGGRVAGGLAARAPGLATLGKAALGGTKMLGKGLSYMVPGLGLMVGLGGAAQAYKKGDILGALTNTAGGLASLLPGLGPLVGIAITAIGDMIPQGIRDAFNKVAGPMITDMITKMMSGIRTFFIEKLGMSGPGFDAMVSVIREATIGTFETIYDVFQNIIRIFKSPLFTKVIYPTLIGAITGLATLATGLFRGIAEVGKMITGFWADLLEGKGLWNAYKTNIIDPVLTFFKSIGEFFSSEKMYKFVRSALPPKLQWAADAIFFGTAQAEKEEKATSSKAFQQMAAQAKEGKLSDAKTAMDLLDREYNRVIGDLNPKTQAAQIQTLMKERQETMKSWKEAPSRLDVKGAVVKAEESFATLRKPEEKPAAATPPEAPKPGVPEAPKPGAKAPEAVKPAVVVVPAPTPGTTKGVPAAAERQWTPEEQKAYVDWHTHETLRVTGRTKSKPMPRPNVPGAPTAEELATATQKESTTALKETVETTGATLTESTDKMVQSQDNAAKVSEKSAQEMTLSVDNLQKTLTEATTQLSTNVGQLTDKFQAVTGSAAAAPAQESTTAPAEPTTGTATTVATVAAATAATTATATTLTDNTAKVVDAQEKTTSTHEKATTGLTKTMKKLETTIKESMGGGAAPAATTHAGLGAVSARWEGAKEGIAAVGFDPTGGTSYGKYQIATRTGTMKEFLQYAAQTSPAIAGRLRAAGAPDTGKQGAFANVWRQIAKDSPEEFTRLQHGFIQKTHYDPVTQWLAGKGLDVSKRSRAVQEAVWSTVVHHGPGGARSVLRNAGINGNMSDEQIVRAIYGERSKVEKYFKSSPAKIQQSIRNRFKDEMPVALKMLGVQTAGTAGEVATTTPVPQPPAGKMSKTTKAVTAAGIAAAGAVATTAATVATKTAETVKDTASQALEAAKNLDVSALTSKLPDLASIAPDLGGLTQLFSGLGADLGAMLGPLATQGGDLLGMLMGGELTAALGSFPGLSPEMLGDLKGQLMTAVTGMQGSLQAEMTRMVQGLGEALGGKPVDPVQHQMLETLQRSTEYQREMMNRDSANVALQAMQTVKDPMLELLAGLGQ